MVSAVMTAARKADQEKDQYDEYEHHAAEQIAFSTVSVVTRTRSLRS